MIPVKIVVCAGIGCGIPEHRIVHSEGWNPHKIIGTSALFVTARSVSQIVPAAPPIRSGAIGTNSCS